MNGLYLCVCPDSSQNDSLSDQEDHRPGFSMPSISSFDDQDADATQASSNFTMYNSVSQKLMVMCWNLTWPSVNCPYTKCLAVVCLFLTPLSSLTSYSFRPRWASVRVMVWGSSARDAKRLWRPLPSEGEGVSVSRSRAFRGSSMSTGVMNQRYTAVKNNHVMLSVVLTVNYVNCMSIIALLIVCFLLCFTLENYFLIYTSYVYVTGCFPSPLFSPFVCLVFCLSVQPSAVEKVDWFPECTTEIPDADELRDWMILGRVNTNA